MSIVPTKDLNVPPTVRPSGRTTTNDVVLGCPNGAMLWAGARLRSPERTVVTDKGHRTSSPSMAGRAISSRH
jgi:hypothetical protein